MSKVLLFVTVLGEIFAHLWRHTTYIGSGRRFATKPTRPYQTLPDPTRPYQTLQDPTRPYQTLQDPTRPYQTLPDPTRPYQTLPDPTRPYQTLQDRLSRNFAKYRSTLRNIPEERRSHWHRGGSLIPRINFCRLMRCRLTGGKISTW